MEIQQPNNVQQAKKNSILLRQFNQIDIQPTCIHQMFFCDQEQNLYVSREKSTQVYHVELIPNNHENNLYFHHIARLPYSKYALKINGMLFLFCPFQLRTKSSDKGSSWVIHPFSTQLLNIRVDIARSMIYSFHQQEKIAIQIDEDGQDCAIKHLAKNKTPFHLNKEGIVEGFGKKITPGGLRSSQGQLFTSLQSKQHSYIVVGDNLGTVHIYDYQTLGHLKSFHVHIGPILCIKIDEKRDYVYFSGSDSKVAVVCYRNEEWVLGGEIRGQSHDILSLELLFDGYLISGGFTTDICSYPIYEQNMVLQSFTHHISYSNEAVAHSIKNYLLINKVTSFQIWKCNEKEQQLEFLVRYQLSPMKFIKDLRISKKPVEGAYLIVLSSENDTVGWKFTQKEGLSKLFTIANSYEFIQFLPGKNIFIGLRDSGDIEKVYCKNGQIQQIQNAEIDLPTKMKLFTDQKLLIASNLTLEVKVFDLKKKTCISKHVLSNVYEILCEKSQNDYLLKYFGDLNLYQCKYDRKAVEQKTIYVMPQQAVHCRFGGTVIHQSTVTKKLKRYWYLAGLNKLFIVNNLNSIVKGQQEKGSNKKIRVRSIYTKQIGTVLKPRGNKHFELGLINLNFRRMIQQMELKPLLAKKIV